MRSEGVWMMKSNRVEESVALHLKQVSQVRRGCLGIIVEN